MSGAGMADSSPWRKKDGRPRSIIAPGTFRRIAMLAATDVIRPRVFNKVAKYQFAVGAKAPVEQMIFGIQAKH